MKKVELQMKKGRKGSYYLGANKGWDKWDTVLSIISALAVTVVLIGVVAMVIDLWVTL